MTTPAVESGSKTRDRSSEKSIDKSTVRATVFGHLSGTVLIPTVRALWEWGVFHMLGSDSGGVAFDQIVRDTRANRGYLRVALRLLVACGWLSQCVAGDGSNSYALTVDGKTALQIAPALCTHAAGVIPFGIRLDALLFGNEPDDAFTFVADYAERAQHRWFLTPSASSEEAIVYQRIRGHLDGLLAGPAMVTLSRRGTFRQLEGGFVALDDLGGNPSRLRSIFEFLAVLGWAEISFNQVGQTQIRLTPEGQYAAQIATSYGVPVSYYPLTNRLPRLLFGDANLPRVDPSGAEVLVDRGMNVWGSGGAHKTYFKKVDEIVLEIFNRPLAEQPAGICDMGCGDAAFLDHLYRVVTEQSLRGRALDTHPLVMVGADFNEIAREISKQTLLTSGVPRFYVIHGDISRPDLLARDFTELGLDIRDFLHVRSFLDHNRPYRAPEGYVKGSRNRIMSGAYSDRGEEIPPDVLEENLVRHLRGWASYTTRFGLLLLELHTLPPERTAANPDWTPAVAYDGVHGYSDQYLVETPVFEACAREAGLIPDPFHHAQYPPSELATVSVDLFRGT
jgi:hypothetical protein